MPGARRTTSARRSVDVFVEIPKGSRAKYEFDKATGRIRLDRVLFSSVHYPADYGFVWNTMGGDGDPLDALVVVEEPTFPGCIVPTRPIGTLLTKDSKGPDAKILGVPVCDPRFDTNLVELAGWRGSRTAWSLIEKSRVGA